MKRAGILILSAFTLSGCSPVENLFWPDSPAPWENVDAVFYPDKDNLALDRQARDVGSLNACRTWVRSMAAAMGDPGMERSDYECGVGRQGTVGDLGVYRLTVR
jgi:hypothetical protein